MGGVFPGKKSRVHWEKGERGKVWKRPVWAPSRRGFSRGNDDSMKKDKGNGGKPKSTNCGREDAITRKNMNLK